MRQLYCYETPQARFPRRDTDNLVREDRRGAREALLARHRQIRIARKQATQRQQKRAARLAAEVVSYERRLAQPWAIVRK